LEEWVRADARDVVCKCIALILNCSEFDTSRVYTELLFDRFMKLGLGFIGHTAVRVGHHQNPIDAEEIGGKDECAKNVVSDSSASISQDLCISRLHSDEGEWTDSRVHTSDDCESSTSRSCERRLSEVTRVFGV
jgi:hypothetical protein